jgi:hypothetical protein
MVFLYAPCSSCFIKKMFCKKTRQKLTKQQAMDACFAEWLFCAFDINGDKILSFKDWTLAFARITRSPTRDATLIALRVFGESRDASHRATKILEHRNRPVVKQDLDHAVMVTSANAFDDGFCCLPIVEACRDMLIEVETKICFCVCNFFFFLKKFFFSSFSGLCIRR